MTDPLALRYALELSQRCQLSIDLRTESDLRHYLWEFFGPWARNALGLDQSALVQEGTGTTGRFDSRIGRAIIEYKRPGSLQHSTTRQTSATQALGYVEDPRMNADVVILTDGITWGHYRDPSSPPEVGEQGTLDLGGSATGIPAEDRFIWRQYRPDSCARILSLIATVRTEPVTSLSIAAKLGIRRDEVFSLIDVLAQSVRHRRDNDRTDTLFRQWLQLAGVSYGITHADDPWPKRKGPADYLGERLTTVLEHNSYAESLFILHTYVALASKIIAMELLSLGTGSIDKRPTSWISLSLPAFETSFRHMENGTLPADLRAPGLLAGDLFGWYAHLINESIPLSNALRSILSVLDELAWARVTNSVHGITGDLLRDFYMSVVPRTLRRTLGEFFTPQWLAERTLSKAINLANKDGISCTVLDPSCGSGTFLVAALKRELVVQSIRLPDDPGEATRTALRRVIGFDINPVAVLMSRINILLSLGDRIEYLTEVAPRVYQTDSILLPDPILGQSHLGQRTDVRRLPLTVGNIDLPASLVTLGNLQILRDNIDRGIKADRPPHIWRQRLKASLQNSTDLLADLEATLDAASIVYGTVRDLHAQGTDGVWARIIEQAFAPATLGGVDLVVGNPPWINWKHLPSTWQERSMPVWKTWGLWPKKATGGGIALSDIAVLLLARSIMTYAIEGGIVALLVPESFLIADPGNERIRACLLGSEDAGGTSVYFRPVAVDDWTAVKPFSSYASNRPVGIYIQTGQVPVWPIPKIVWRRSVPGTRLPTYKHWPNIAPLLSSDEETIEPVESGNTTSPWVSRGGLVLLAKDDPRIYYRWGQGFHTRGVDGLYTVEVLSRQPDRGLVLVRSLPSVGDNTRGESPRSGLIEAEFLWPLVRGGDVDRFRIRDKQQYAILPHDPDDPNRFLTVRELIEKGPRLYDFLEPLMQRLIDRSPYGKLQPSADKPWGVLGPTEHFSRRHPIVLSRYIFATKRPPTAVYVPRWDQRLGLETVCYPNNKSNMFVTQSLSEAHYVAAWINSNPAQASIARLVSSTTITPVALKRLPMPRFDPANRIHQRLSEIARQSEGIGLSEYVEMDRLVRSSAIVQ